MADLPLVFYFRVEFLFSDGQSDIDMRFQEVSGLGAEIGVEEFNEGGENRFSRKLPGRAKFGNLVLKRAMAADSRLVEWIESAVYGFEFEPVDLLVSLLNENGDPLFTWSFTRAWPVKWQAADLNATESALAIETIELSYDYFTRSA
ncbi:Uncharacterised protein [BD1-7 clade bacterium]|uniref:Phage tail protein n=1 Tax=BD1-7 clade bacterium TaxID=2029982 RepID=A0A5S9QNQ8_9GAMM|nr:Uncharacterised protein [BD1-7 clade bacterium]CAA0120201.1 Uncharacterised protein [BD1-7 clade bacterium]CAA0121177.1 Uncharacterised protein [BD1-7 clade bacterium]